MQSKRVALVTGASRGIGRATAIRLAQDFAGVVVVARTGADLATTAEAVASAGATPLAIEADLRDPRRPSHVISMALETFGRLDAVINVAGAVPQTDLFTMSDEEWDEGLALKFHGARRMALAAWDPLEKSAGSLVFTSGSSALAPKAALAAVGTINAAISAMAKAFAERGTADSIQVNAILPGPVMTGRRKSMLVKYAAQRDIDFEAARETFAREAGIGRYGEPEDIAALVAFVVSPAAHWLTGAALRMDGGEIKTI